MEHLVENHLTGDYYVSNRDPKFIEQYCEVCEDSDEILASWDPLIKNAKRNSILKYVIRNILNTREDIYNKAKDFDYYSQWYSEDIITLLLNDIDLNSEEMSNIIIYLYENKIINKSEFDFIVHIIDFEEERQIKMLKYFEKSMFTIDKKTGEKVLKKKS